METGNNSLAHPQTPTSTTLGAEHNVVVNLRYDGITVVIAEAQNKQVLQILEAAWDAERKPTQLIHEANRFFSTQQISMQSAHSVHWVLSLSKFVLIPDILFQQGDGAELLKNATRLEEGEVVHSDFWPKQDAVAVYAVPEELTTYIFSLSEKTTIAHCGHSFNMLHQRQSHKDNFCHLQVSPTSADFFLVKDGKLIFFTQFSYQQQEDLLYYLLFALEQNGILAPELEMRVAGNILKGDGLYQTLSTYIGKVQEIDLPAGVRSARDITPNILRRHAHLIASL